MLRINIAIAVAPALFLLWLFKKWDEKRPEPPGAVRNCVLFGVASCVPAILIELGESAALGDLAKEQGQFLNAFFIAGLTEEALKLAVVLIFLWRKPYFDEVMDGILYTAAASLGFALIENVLYSAANPVTGLVRAFTAVPLHAVASGIMGYFVGRAKFAKGGGTLVWLVFGLMTAVTIHGLYDWILMSQGGFGFMEPNSAVQFSILGLVLVCGLILYALVRHALKLDDELLGSHARPLQPPMPMPMQPPPAAAASGYAYAAPSPYGTAPVYGTPQAHGYPPQTQGYPPPAAPPAAYAQTAVANPYAPPPPPPPTYGQPPAPAYPPTQPYAAPPNPYPPDPNNPYGNRGGGQGS
jgi:RsiW-degrading membrane proteinase PrsW (M82 family)